MVSLHSQLTIMTLAKLGVDVLATQTEIKRAFLKQAQRYHPDRNPSPEAKGKFTSINEAYETLGNEEKRKIYDATGMSSNDQSNHEASGFSFNPFGFAFGGSQHAQDMRSFDEILKEFEEFFAMEENSNSKIEGVKGRDIHREIEIDFLTSVQGSS